MIGDTVTSPLVDLSHTTLDELLRTADDSNLAAALKRIRDEAESDPRKGISAFNSAF